MRKLLSAFLLLMAVGIGFSSCGKSKEEKEREQFVADSLRKDSIQKAQVADSIQKVKDEEARNDEKIAFLKRFYTSVVYATDSNIGSIDSYASKLKHYLSDKVLKAMTDYDDGMDTDMGVSDNEPKFYLLGDDGDYGPEGPSLKIEYLKDQWFSVDIAGNNQLKVRIACNPEDEDDFIITGLKNDAYEFSVE